MGDVAKEVWIYRPDYACVNPKEPALEPAIFGKSYGTDAQMFVAAAAPEMYAALKAAKRHSTATSCGVGELIDAAIMKAEGLTD